MANSVKLYFTILSDEIRGDFFTPPSSVEGTSAFSSPSQISDFKSIHHPLTCVDLPRTSFFITRGLFISYKNQSPGFTNTPPISNLNGEISNPDCLLLHTSMLHVYLSLCTIVGTFKPPLARIPEILGGTSRA